MLKTTEQRLHQDRTSSITKGLPRLAAAAMCALIHDVTKSVPDTFQLSGYGHHAARVTRRLPCTRLGRHANHITLMQHAGIQTLSVA